MSDRAGGSESSCSQAVQIALEGETLEWCKACDDEVCVKDYNLEPAYRIASRKFKQRQVSGFGSQRALIFYSECCSMLEMPVAPV